MEFSLKQLADTLQLRFVGEPATVVDSIAPIHLATERQLSFVVGKHYVDALRASRAGVVIVPPALEAEAPGNYILSPDPYMSYAKLSHLMNPAPALQAGIHPSAVVHDEADIDPSASIGANAVIGRGVRVGAGCDIGAGCFLGDGTRIGDRSRLFANVTIYHGCRLGSDCRVQSGTVIGGEGFGYARDKTGWLRINQVGGVLIGDRVEIASNTSIDRGAIGDTIIEDGVILDNLIQIAHNVRIGRNTAIAGCTGIAGSTTIGSNCTIAGSVNIIGHLTIVDDVHLTATSFVMRSITEPGRYSSGLPLETNRKWRRTVARLLQLDSLAAKINRQR